MIFDAADCANLDKHLSDLMVARQPHYTSTRSRGAASSVRRHIILKTNNVILLNRLTIDLSFTDTSLQTNSTINCFASYSLNLNPTYCLQMNYIINIVLTTDEFESHLLLYLLLWIVKCNGCWLYDAKPDTCYTSHGTRRCLVPTTSRMCTSTVRHKSDTAWHWRCSQKNRCFARF